MKLNKKGQLAQLGGLAVGVATLAITLVVIFLLLAQGKTQMCSIEGVADCTNTSQYSVGLNGTNTLTNAVADIPAWVPLIIIGVVGVALLGLVAMFRKAA